MVMNLLVVGDRARVNPLMSLLSFNGIKATALRVRRNIMHILEELKSHPEKNILIVFGDTLEDAPGFTRVFQWIPIEVRLIVVAGTRHNPPTPSDSFQLLQKIRTTAFCRALYSYKPGNHAASIRESTAEKAACISQEERAGIRCLNGRTIFLEKRLGEIFDIVIKAEGKVVPWRELRQHFENRGTMYGAIKRLRQALKNQYPAAGRALATHRQMGVVFNSCLLLAK